MLDDYLYSNHYYQKKVNLDPERCQINLERAIRRKHLESQVSISCQHTKNDWCQIRNIDYEDLEDFHDRYWNCVGTVNKRVFVAQYLTVHPVCHDRKRDINITCRCPTKNGRLELICQKSFISVLGVSKHKVLAIGRAKLLNGEQLIKETRGGKRGKNKSKYNNEPWDLESSTIDSNQSENGNDSRNNQIIKNKKDTEEDNDENSENESEERNFSQPTIFLAESFNDNGVFEQKININESLNNKSSFNDDYNSNDSDIEICSPILPIVHISESPYNSDDDDDNGDVKMYEPDIEMNESIITDNISVASQPSPSSLVRLEPRNDIYIRKKTQQLPHLMRQFNTKTTAASGAFVLHPQKYEVVKIKVNNDKNEQQLKHIEVQQRIINQYLGPTNWKRTIERNQRRLQREKEVSISCTHNMTRFCKIQHIPKQDLVNFHQEYWRCNGIVEERIFLARYLIVTPQSHRRVMTIMHRIPSSDGNIYEVCQKSFLSVVGITKHKVQAAARAVLRGELFKKDGRGGSKVKHLRNINDKSIIEYNNENDDNNQLISDRDTSNYSQTKDCTLQISQVIGNYKPGMNGICNIEIKSEPAIEIQDSNEYSNYTTSIEDNIDFKIINNRIEEKSFGQVGNGQHNYKKNVQIKDKLTRNQIKRNLFYYKRKSKKLIKDRKRLWGIISRLRMENISLKNMKSPKL